MSLSNTATPIYYGQFREAVLRGEIPICKEIEMEMYRIDALIENPNVYYDDEAVEGWIEYCESELTLTDGSDLTLLDTFKLWGEQVFGWFYFVDRSVYQPYPDGHGGRCEGRETAADASLAGKQPDARISDRQQRNGEHGKHLRLVGRTTRDRDVSRVVPGRADG